MNERRSYVPPEDNRAQAGLDSYARGENVTQQTALRLMSLENTLAVGLFGKKSSEASEPERVVLDRAKSLMTNAERLRFPQMTKTELAQLSIDLLDRYGKQES